MIPIQYLCDMSLLCYFLTQVSTSYRGLHSPSTTALKSLRSQTILSISLKLYPTSFMSVTRLSLRDLIWPVKQYFYVQNTNLRLHAIQRQNVGTLNICKNEFIKRQGCDEIVLHLKSMLPYSLNKNACPDEAMFVRLPFLCHPWCWVNCHSLYIYRYVSKNKINLSILYIFSLSIRSCQISVTRNI